MCPLLAGTPNMPIWRAVKHLNLIGLGKEGPVSLHFEKAQVALWLRNLKIREGVGFNTRAQNPGHSGLGSNPGCATCELCDLGKVT